MKIERSEAYQEFKNNEQELCYFDDPALKFINKLLELNGSEYTISSDGDTQLTESSFFSYEDLSNALIWLCDYFTKSKSRNLNINAQFALDTIKQNISDNTGQLQIPPALNYFLNAFEQNYDLYEELFYFSIYGVNSSFIERFRSKFKIIINKLNQKYETLDKNYIQNLYQIYIEQLKNSTSVLGFLARLDEFASSKSRKIDSEFTKMLNADLYFMRASHQNAVKNSILIPPTSPFNFLFPLVQNVYEFQIIPKLSTVFSEFINEIINTNQYGINLSNFGYNKLQFILYQLIQEIVSGGNSEVPLREFIQRFISGLNLNIASDRSINTILTNLSSATSEDDKLTKSLVKTLVLDEQIGYNVEPIKIIDSIILSVFNRCPEQIKSVQISAMKVMVYNCLMQSDSVESFIQAIVLFVNSYKGDYVASYNKLAIELKNRGNRNRRILNSIVFPNQINLT